VKRSPELGKEEQIATPVLDPTDPLENALLHPVVGGEEGVGAVLALIMTGIAAWMMKWTV